MKHSLLPRLFFSLLVLAVGASGFAQSPALPFLNRVLNEHQAQAGNSGERLATGQLRLVDDPARYAVFEALERQIQELGKVIENQGDMALLYQYEGDLLGQMVEALQRIRELAVQRNNGTLSGFDREIIDGEVDQEYDQILDDLGNTNFNGVPVFRAWASDRGVRASVQDASHRDLASVDRLLGWMNAERASVGARQNRLEFSQKGDAVRRENSQAAQGGVDFGAEAAEFRRNQLLFLANLLMLKMETGTAAPGL